jgi:O-methyltransferase
VIPETNSWAHELRRTLRFWRHVPPGDLASPRKILAAFKVRPNTLLSYPRLSALFDLATDVERKRIPGSLVECGVWNGGSAGIMAVAVEDSRDVWLFDSWEGLPEPGEIDTSVTGIRREKGWDLGSIDNVKRLFFHKLSVDQSRVHVVKGWFEETLPVHRRKVGAIALLHLDGDWYASIKRCLEELYDQVSPGGYVAIDDYGYWKGCKQAVDEFITTRGLDVAIVDIDGNAIFFQKPERESRV